MNDNPSIDTGEYFVITRGFQLNTDRAGLFSLVFGDSEEWKEPAESSEPHFDRSYEGMVFVAGEVCGPVIAATCVFGGGYKSTDIGKKYSFNTTELKVWPVTKAYIEALKEPA